MDPGRWTEHGPAPTVARRLQLFPVTAQLRRGQDGAGQRLFVGGCDLAALADAYGTPLYLYDEASMAQAVEAYRRALAQHYPGKTGITYAGKAFLNVAVARWMARRGLWLDCTGVGELHIATVAGIPRQQVLVHGVNKSEADLRAAVAGAGTIVVDNLTELERLLALRRGRSHFPHLWLRLRPGLAVDTHAYRQTGQEDSKFGMEDGEAVEAVALCQAEGLPLTGIHFHQGSHFHDPAPVVLALEHVLDLVLALRRESGWTPQTVCPGGGWGVAYHEDDRPHPSIDDYVAPVAERLVQGCRDRGLALPTLHVEPGRSLIARAGVAIYRVGCVKQTAGRRWVLLDGGMADNIRPALYGARYSALPVVEPARPATGKTWLAGPYCESGDILIGDIALPEVAPGDLVALPASGAYHLMMASNYNGARRPAVVLVGDGNARLMQRRETVDDLVRRDVLEG